MFSLVLKNLKTITTHHTAQNYYLFGMFLVFLLVLLLLWLIMNYIITTITGVHLSCNDIHTKSIILNDRLLIYIGEVSWGYIHIQYIETTGNVEVNHMSKYMRCLPLMDGGILGP